MVQQTTLSFTQGDAYSIVRTVTGFQQNDPIARAWFTVKRSPQDSDANAVAQVQVTTTVTPLGYVVASGTVGMVYITVPAATTALFDYREQYWFDIQVATASGLPYTPDWGIVQTRPGITGAT